MKYLLIAIAITAADQFTKRCAEHKFKDGNKAIIGKLCFCNVRNSGAAMGLLADKPHLLAVLTAGSTAQVLLNYYRIYNHGKLDGTYKLSLACLLGGAAGNIIDRVRRGYVTDFIQIGKSPVFNIADIFISLGVIIYMVKRIVGKSQ